ncbi:MAG: CHAT domain-containing protein, partial [Desulfobacterales bacterium]|nr:CHAT domain-containing protein [Desulfobacterales bacterium]
MPSSAAVYTLRLVINREDDHYTGRWIETDGQETDSFDVTLPLTEADMAEMRWYPETYYQFPGAGDHTRAEGIQARLNVWGKALFDAVFGTVEGAHMHRDLLDREARGDRCLVTLGAEDPRVLGQPWEMMRDKRGPLVFRGVTIRRQLKGARIVRTRALELPLRVLLIVSRPSDIGFIDPRNSIPPILDALDTLPEGMAEVSFCDPPTLARLEKTISEARKAKQPYHIVHFDGHGTYLPKIGVGTLAFERENAKNHLVSGAELGDLLSRLDIPLALLEACRGSDLSDRPVFGSVAPALLKAGVGSVVAFSHSVHIKAARILVERFYAELAAGMTVGQALEESRSALHADRSRWLRPGPDAETIDLQDWFIPQLYQVGPDPALIMDGRAESGPARPRGARGIRKRMHGEFPPRPMYQFHGRAQELLKLERFFRGHSAVVISGMGGMGKTALAREAAAWWLRTGRFESAVFVSFEQKAGAERVVQVLGAALEENFSARSAGDQWETAVDLFHERPVLLIWDNFESTLPIYQNRDDL